MILLIDNYDSFVHNLARYVTLAGKETKVVRNDAITIAEIESLSPEAIIISPGPCTPKEAGISIEVIKRLGPEIPILGVCLGHQCIAESYGGNTIKGNPVHGKASVIDHDGTGIFESLPRPLAVGRYHSLITIPPEDGSLHIQARTDAGEIMAFSHNICPVHGVQFHPESILTQNGMDMIKNFIKIAQNWTSQRKAA